MKTKIFLLVLFSALCITGLQAQKAGKKFLISGSVTDAGGNPVSNAIVMVDGKNTSSVTGPDGKYKIKISPSAERLGMFSIGSGIIEEAIAGRVEINFQYKKASANQTVSDDSKTGDGGINTGYGYVQEKNVTSQINKIDGTKKKYATYRTIYEMIVREVPGVKLQGNSIIIQDSKDFFGSVPALLVVDGTYTDDISNIAPIMVESIEVLKGGAAAMYGSRGFGGVVVIKTKNQIK